MTMPALPDLKRSKASARLVRAGLFWVTFSSASFLRKVSVSTFLSELMTHLPSVFQSPPLLNSHMENSPCDSSGPSGRA